MSDTPDCRYIVYAYDAPDAPVLAVEDTRAKAKQTRYYMGYTKDAPIYRAWKRPDGEYEEENARIA